MSYAGTIRTASGLTVDTFDYRTRMAFNGMLCPVTEWRNSELTIRFVYPTN